MQVVYNTLTKSCELGNPPENSDEVEPNVKWDLAPNVGKGGCGVTSKREIDCRAWPSVFKPTSHLTESFISQGIILIQFCRKYKQIFKKITWRISYRGRGIMNGKGRTNSRIQVLPGRRYVLTSIMFVTLWSCYKDGEDRGGTVVKVLCYKSEGRWFDPNRCQWIFH